MYMKKVKLNLVIRILLVANCSLLLQIAAYSQVGINSSGLSAANSAMLDVSSSDKGMLIPRVSLTNVSNYAPLIGDPVTSLLVYSITAPAGGGGAGFYYWNGSQWVQAIGPTGSTGPTGAAGSNGAIGATGPTGTAGTNGAAGATGPTGANGALNAWGLTGNAGVSGNFLGTTAGSAYAPIDFKVNGNLVGKISSSSIFLGAQAGNVNNGQDNVGIGNQALYSNIWGGPHVSIGYQSLYFTTGGQPSVGIGRLALYSNQTGGNNNAIGNCALYSNTGSNNTAFGSTALFYNSTGNNNTALGYNAFVNGAAYSNSMALGANAVDISGDNQIHIGNVSIVSIQGQVGFTTYSDARIKNNVQENVPGLSFIKELRPVTYYFDIDKENEITGAKDTAMLEGKYDIEKIQFSGFLAQEVDAAAKKVNYSFSGVDKSGTLLGLRYAEFVVPLVKAVQELNDKNNSLQLAVGSLKAENKNLKAQFNAKLKSQQAEIEQIKQQLGMEAKK